MKKHVFLISLVFTLIVPAIIISALGRARPSQIQSTQMPVEGDPTNPLIRILTGDGVEYMDIETYVASVVLGEMPTDFEAEALKAQAVAVRTYTLRGIENGGKHAQADLCTDPSCCQAFSRLDHSDAAIRVQRAAQETEAEVLLFDNQLIEATYFSCSGGRTEAAVEVWGMDVPYLQAVNSPGEEDASHYQDTQILSKQDFLYALGLQTAEISEITYTAGGGVKTMKIGGALFSGLQLRQLLNLRSTVFTITLLEDSVVINTKGFGHRVGMSQYGAEAMAVSGSTYDQILAYYYPGTDLKTMSPTELARVFDKAGNL